MADCAGCGQSSDLVPFGYTNGHLRAKCNACRAAGERARRAKTNPIRHCSVCGGPLHGSALLDVCRRNPECKRVSTSQHNYLKTRRRKSYPPCAGCGGDWLRAGRGEKLCPACRETQFWCYGFRPGTAHVAPLRVRRPRSQGCRACLLLRFALTRAKARGLPFALTTGYVESIWNDTCPYLGIPLVGGVGKLTRTSPTLDRIIPAAGYVEGNVEVISHRANTMKCEASPDELVTFAHVLLRRYTGIRQVAS
jgi:hypothetical protein